MARWLSVAAAIVLLPFAGALSKTRSEYLVGRVARIESARLGSATLYEIYIQGDSQTFAVRLALRADQSVPWKLNDPVEYRIRDHKIDLLQPDGKLITRTIQTASPHAAILLALDLPFPTAPPSIATVIPAGADTTVARCRQTLNSNAQYRGLMSACQFALSPRNLPDFLCKETMQRNAGVGSPPFWQPVDTLSMEVTFLAGGTDRYSDFRPYDPRLQRVPGWLSLAQFGNEIEAIFDPAAHTRFAYRGMQKLPSGSASIFAFEFDAANNLRFRIEVGHVTDYPGLTGLLWTDDKTGQLIRIQAYATELNPNFDVRAWAGAVNYGEATIAGLGSFLLPAADEVEVCLQNGTCYKNIMSFGECRRFQSTIHLLPSGRLPH